MRSIFLLLSNIAGRRWGEYVIDGSVGILHRKFEEHWSATAKEARVEVGPTASLHVANILELVDLGYVDPHKPLETQVYPWCECAVRVLSRLPATRTELSAAYREKRPLLASFPLESFLPPLPQIAEKNKAFLKSMDGNP